MTQLLQRRETKSYRTIAASLAQDLSQTAVQRDLEGGSPVEELDRLRDSGLLPLVVPAEYGGLGVSWAEALKVVQELSKADGSIGQLYGNHLNLAALGHVSGTPEQKERFYRETAEQQLFWLSGFAGLFAHLLIDRSASPLRKICSLVSSHALQVLG